jgi:hypothetical protein
VALLELPNKTPSAADDTAAGDRQHQAAGSGPSRYEQPAQEAVTEPTPGICVPQAAALVHTTKETGSNDQAARQLKSTASMGSTAAAEHTATRTGLYSTTISHVAAVADAAGRQGAGGSSSISGTYDAWLGQLHVSFVQLPQKAPPRLKAPSCKARDV